MAEKENLMGMSDEEALKFLACECHLPHTANERDISDVLREEYRKDLACEFGLDPKTATWDQITKCLDKQGLPDL